MSHNISEQRLGEKLLVLNNQANGLLTRLHLARSHLSESSRPSYLNKGNKLYDSIHKALIKTFPQINQKYASSLEEISNIRNDILNEMSFFYYNFVDVLDLRNHIIELFGCLSGARMQMDIVLNFDLTRNYLDLVANYFSLMYLFCQFEDRVLIVALFNQAYISKHSIQESSFPRLSQLILDFLKPLHQLHIDLNPYSSLLTTALGSLSEIYFKRLTKTVEWMQSQPFSLLAEAPKMSQPVLDKISPPDLLGGEDMERWIIFGYLMIHPSLQDSEANKMWKAALSNSFVVTVFRNVVIEIHPLVTQYFDTVKHYNKKVADVREYMTTSYGFAPQFHRERRKYLRGAMQELYLLFSDQPGLLGPKISVLLLTLSYARDEILWLMRHTSNLPNKKSPAKCNVSDFYEQGIPEYLAHIENLREICKANSDVLQIYYLQTIAGYDAPLLSNCITTLSGLRAQESEILNDMIKELKDLSTFIENGKLVNFSNPPELSAIRMDWFRLQTCLSEGSCQEPFSNLKPLFLLMNTTTFNTKMVDYLEGALESTSDLSFLYFYASQLHDYFKKARAIPAQHRYITSIARVTSHFSHICHEMCPEEVESIKENSFKFAHKLCLEVSREMCQALFLMAPQLGGYAYELLPKEAIYWIVSSNLKSKKRNKSANPGGVGPNGNPERGLPGTESIRRFREQMTQLDQLSVVLGELCTAVNGTREIVLFERSIHPVEIFLAELKERLRKFIGELIIHEPNNTITRPSEVQNCLDSQFNIFMTLENYLPIRISNLFKECLSDHILIYDSVDGRVSLTGQYVRWYSEVLIPYLSTESVVYSTVTRSFVDKRPGVENLLQYADINELRALADLLCADGIMLLSDQVVGNIQILWEELRRLLLVNRTTLDSIWESHADGNTKRQHELAQTIQNPTDILQRLKALGVLMIFRGMLKEALNSVLEVRAPFLTASVKEVHHMSRDLVHFTDGQSSFENHLSAARLASGFGFPTDGLAVDADLVRELHQETDGDYILGCLLPVCLASLMPRIARSEGCHYRDDLGAFANNMHCMVPAVLTLVNVLLMSTNHVDNLENQWKTFLSLSTTNLLPLEHEAVTRGSTSSSYSQGVKQDPPKNRQAVYILLDMIVQSCPYLTYNQLELCFPYALIRSAYHDAALIPK